MKTREPIRAGGAAGTMFQAPSVLLLVTGTLVGLNFPLGKLAGKAGVSPVLWALLISLGASTVLLPVLILRRELGLPSRWILRYSAISALISFVGPNLLLFTVIPHTGAGYAGLMFALSPVFTVLFAAICRLKTPGRLGMLGIVVGLAGAAVVSLTRGADPAGPGPMWLLTALLVPVGLAAGNVYRTVDWPAGASAKVLAFFGHAIASAVFVLILEFTDGGVPLASLRPAAGAALVQMLVAGLAFPALFQLQQRGGPVLLSQIGYVAAAVGLVAGTVFLGERYPASTWLGAAVIAAGIAITLVAQVRER